MQFLLKLICCASLCLCAGSALAQKHEDSLRVDGISVGIDPIRAGMLAGKNGSIETNVGVNRGPHWLLAEYGQRQLVQEQVRFNYKATGWWLRLGYEYNLFKQGDDALAVGGRYSFGRFSHQATNIVLEDPYYGTRTVTNGPEESARTNWLEGTATLRMRVWQGFQLGFTIRAMYRLNTKYQDFAPLTVPGFGNATNKIQPAFNYWLIYKLPLRKYVYYEARKKKE